MQEISPCVWIHEIDNESSGKRQSLRGETSENEGFFVFVGGLCDEDGQSSAHAPYFVKHAFWVKKNGTWINDERV